MCDHGDAQALAGFSYSVGFQTGTRLKDKTLWRVKFHRFWFTGNYFLFIKSRIIFWVLIAIMATTFIESLPL